MCLLDELVVGQHSPILLDAVFEGEVEDDAGNGEGHQEPNDDHLGRVGSGSLLLQNGDFDITELDGLVD